MPYLIYPKTALPVFRGFFRLLSSLVKVKNEFNISYDYILTTPSIKKAALLLVFHANNPITTAQFAKIQAPFENRHPPVSV